MIEVARRFAELTAEERELDAKLKDVRRRKEALQETVQQSLLMEGVQRIALDVGPDRYTVYVDRRWWARPKDGVERRCVADALIEAGGGWADLVRNDFNVTSLSSSVAEAKRQGVEIPESVARLLDMEEVPTAKARLASRSSEDA